MDNRKNIGIVIIGRNEGDRLRRAIDSILNKSCLLVYVDSGSNDDSVEYCQARKIDVVELDTSRPFSAGRARNAGFQHLKNRGMLPDYVQFMDGDCTLDESWLDKGKDYLSLHKDIALVCGVRKEIHPERSIYNFLCNLEWDGPKGEIKESGGDFLIRSEIFEQLNGFNEEIIAGEEPELCFRIREAGFRIHRLDIAMTYHDANMTSIRQWWARSVRSGHSYANVAHLHASSTEQIYRKETISILVWGVILPLLLLVGVLISMPLVWFVLLLYTYLFIKVFFRAKRIWAIKPLEALYYSANITFGKFPHGYGVIKYFYRAIARKQFFIIEYK